MTESSSYTLKSFFSAGLVRRLAADLARVHPGFDQPAFAAAATRGLAKLELIARARHIATALAAHLPRAYPRALDVLLRSLGPELGGDENLGAGMAPFYYLPHTIFVAEHGLEHFDLSLRAQYELTKRFSCEWSMRTYLAHDAERTLRVLRRWRGDSDAHVRRLVSECTRLRLPWATRVAWLDRHPERVLELIEPLKDDPSSMVRRSVANNLNDLAKLRLDLVLASCARWLEGAPAPRRALVEHALRSAVRRGEPAALELVGYGRAPQVRLGSVRFTPQRVAIGGRVEFGFALESASAKPQELLVDVAVHFVKASGAVTRKVFKLKRVALEPRARVAFEKSFSLAVHTTRVPHPGTHEVSVLVNGRPLRAGSFEVVP